MSFFFDAEAYARKVHSAPTSAEMDKALVAITELPAKKREKASRALENTLISEMSAAFGDVQAQVNTSRLLQEFVAVNLLLGRNAHDVTKIVTEEAKKEPVEKLTEAETSRVILERAAKRTAELRKQVRTTSGPRRFGM